MRTPRKRDAHPSALHVGISDCSSCYAVLIISAYAGPFYKRYRSSTIHNLNKLVVQRKVQVPFRTLYWQRRSPTLRHTCQHYGPYTSNSGHMLSTLSTPSSVSLA